MKIESKITLMNVLINSGVMAAAVIAVVLITREIISKSKK